MLTSFSDGGNDPRIKHVALDDISLRVELIDGRKITVPINWYPLLARATEEQRHHWQLCQAGRGIHWPELDEDLSAAGLLRQSGFRQ